MCPLPKTVPLTVRAAILLLASVCLLALAGCGVGDNEEKAEYGYITAPTLALRDRVAQVYNKVAFVNNGDRVRIVERHGNKRFVKVRTDDGKEGWIPQRYLAPQEVFDQFAGLAQQNSAKVSQAGAVTRRVVNMHATPAREGAVLYQLKEGERLELLSRQSAPRVQPRPAPRAPEPPAPDEDRDKAKESEEEEPAPPEKPAPVPAPKKSAAKAVPPAPGVPMEDWWLVRDSRKRVGWILGRMVDVDIPLDVAQYAEGKRIVASYVLSEVPEKGGPQDKLVPQYLVLLTEPKDGMPFDFNQLRVFTWNQKRLRYETAYRERLTGQLPFRAGQEGGNPFFVIRAEGPDGTLTERRYRMQGVMVRRVIDETAQPAQKSPPAPAKRPA